LSNYQVLKAEGGNAGFCLRSHRRQFSQRLYRPDSRRGVYRSAPIALSHPMKDLNGSILQNYCAPLCGIKGLGCYGFNEGYLIGFQDSKDVY
jgi:hypothetical protein